MSLMPLPRRSPRFSPGKSSSGNEYGRAESSHGRAGTEVASAKAAHPRSQLQHADLTDVQGRASGRSHAGKSWNESIPAVKAKAAASKGAAVVERRFEDIDSDSDDGRNGESSERQDFLTGFDRPLISGNKRHAASIPLPRQPRATFHEEAGDDGFIFSAVEPVASTSKQAQPDPSRTHEGSRPAQKESLAGPPRHPTSRAVASARDEGGPSSSLPRQRRVSSGAVKAVRRVSNLRDGTTAHPHPTIANDDLFRHCSTELDAQDRMRHMTNWTLERSSKKLLSRFSASSDARSALHSSIRSTLRSLSNGELTLDWPGRTQKGRAGHAKLKAHPRNEANRRVEKSLVETVDAMQSEVRQWEQMKEELKEFEGEVEALERKAAGMEQGDNTLTSSSISVRSMLLRTQDAAASSQSDDDRERDRLSRFRAILAQQAPWLSLENQKRPEETTPIESENDLLALVQELYTEMYDESVPVARPLKRRRTTSAIPSADHEDGLSLPSQQASSSQSSSVLQGTESDPRWSDVEWNTDRLREKAHQIAQLGHAAHLYTTAVSARGAQAIGDLININDAHSSSGAASTSSLSRSGTTSSRKSQGGSSSKISRDSQHTLQRILAGIRQVERDNGASANEDDDTPAAGGGQSGAEGAATAVATHHGDISDGDILRAFAGISGKRHRP